MEINNAIPINLILVVDHLRKCVRDTPNKSALARESDVDLQQLWYFGRVGASAPSPALLTALAKKFLPDYVIAPKHLVRDKDAA